MFKKSMRKYIFKTSNIFCIKKKRSKHVRVLAVYSTQENIFYIYFLSKRKHHEKYSPIPKFARSLKQLISNKQGSAHKFKTQVSVHKTLKKKKQSPEANKKLQHEP
jgi:hypothetical protein